MSIRDRPGQASQPELRLDPLSGSKVIVSPSRSERPFDFMLNRWQSNQEGACPLCEGNEPETPPEVFELGRQGEGADSPGWKVRAVPNKYPMLVPMPEGVEGTEQGVGLFVTAQATGSHEVIVHTPQHLTSLVDLDSEQLELAVDGWRRRMAAHSQSAYCHLMVNEGAAAGASLEHSHAQLLALPFVPAAVTCEVERFNSYQASGQGECLLCDILREEERRAERVVELDDEMAIIAPFASQLPYQLQIAPHHHEPRFEQGTGEIAQALKKALTLLERALGQRPPINIWVRTAPKSVQDFHWRIDILPRLTGLAGVELGTGTFVNTVPPEVAVVRLRDLD